MRKSISIIIPIYNSEKYIISCLGCIVSQTYPNTLIECIIINDGSFDNSAELSKEFISNYKGNIRFKLINHKTNKGLAEARNTGIKVATGSYLYFMDSDDHITNNCIEKLFAATELYPDADIIVGNSINKKNNSIHHNQEDYIYFNSRKQILSDTLMLIYTAFAWNKLVKYSFLTSNNLYFYPKMKYYEDLYWNLEIAQHINAIVYIPDIIYIYEFTDNSLMSTINQNWGKVIFSKIELIRKAWLLYNEEYEIETHLFIGHQIYQILSHPNIDKEVRKMISTERKDLVKRVLLFKHPLLLLYDLLLFNPLRQITKFRFYRSRYMVIRLWVYHKTKKN